MTKVDVAFLVFFYVLPLALIAAVLGAIYDQLVKIARSLEKK